METFDWNELLSYLLLTVAGVIGETRQAAIFIPGIVEIMVTRGVNIFVGGVQTHSILQSDYPTLGTQNSNLH